MQWLNQLSHSIAGIAHALTEILTFLHEIREAQRESNLLIQQNIELLEKLGAETVGEILDKIDIMEKLKISKKTYERYVADQLLNPSELGGKHYYTDADISEALRRNKKYRHGQ